MPHRSPAAAKLGVEDSCSSDPNFGAPISLDFSMVVLFILEYFPDYWEYP